MSDNWNAYSSYNNVLRAWFVAFGVGAPATFLINDSLVKYISPGTGNPYIFKLFLYGAIAQVLMAFINKTINWCNLYKEEIYENNPKGFWQHTSHYISKAHNWYLIDFACDVITIVCFGKAIWMLFNLVAG